MCLILVAFEGFVDEYSLRMPPPPPTSIDFGAELDHRPFTSAEGYIAHVNDIVNTSLGEMKENMEREIGRIEMRICQADNETLGCEGIGYIFLCVFFPISCFLISSLSLTIKCNFF